MPVTKTKTLVPYICLMRKEEDICEEGALSWGYARMWFYLYLIVLGSFWW
jgi:hypothetical protein